MYVEYTELLQKLGKSCSSISTFWPGLLFLPFLRLGDSYWLEGIRYLLLILSLGSSRLFSLGLLLLDHISWVLIVGPALLDLLDGWFQIRLLEWNCHFDRVEEVDGLEAVLQKLIGCLWLCLWLFCRLLFLLKLGFGLKLYWLMNTWFPFFLVFTREA
jgi:hypothetical protein